MVKRGQRIALYEIEGKAHAGDEGLQEKKESAERDRKNRRSSSQSSAHPQNEFASAKRRGIRERTKQLASERRKPGSTYREITRSALVVEMAPS